MKENTPGTLQRCTSIFAENSPWDFRLGSLFPYLIDNIGCVFASASAMVKISVLFHCVVLGAELEFL